MTTILGLSTSPHDSAAALVKDGELVCAIEEEKLTRIRHGIEYDNSKYTLETEAEYFDTNFLELPQKAFEKKIRAFQKYFKEAGYDIDDLDSLDITIGSNLLASEVPIKGHVNINHHLAHAAHAFYTSPYDRAAILVIDGSGNVAKGGFETVSIYEGRRNEILLREKVVGTITHETSTTIALGNSIGVMYQNVSVLCGFGTFGEGTLMGLASFGTPRFTEVYMTYCNKKDGRYEIDNLGLYEYVKEQIKRNEEDRVHKADIAASIQEVTNCLIFHYAQRARNITGCKNLCYAGGVALNATSNTKILNATLFERIYIPSAPGDGGTAIGAALYGYHCILKQNRTVSETIPRVYMGRSYSEHEVATAIEAITEKVAIEKLDDEAVAKRVAVLLHEGKIIGWFQGKSEFGPRALGNRSILASPLKAENRNRLNVIKHRQSFRPVAPVVPAEIVDDYFALPSESIADSLAYMLFTPESYDVEIAKKIPAVIHVDNTARVQTVTATQNPKLHCLLEAFGAQSGIPILINTSFNTKGEPMVETPSEALETFLLTDIDCVIIDNYCITKHET